VQPSLSVLVALKGSFAVSKVAKRLFEGPAVGDEKNGLAPRRNPVLKASSSPVCDSLLNSIERLKSTFAVTLVLFHGFGRRCPQAHARRRLTARWGW
jgi:hypothetical protein